MNLLAIDTSTVRTVLALVGSRGQRGGWLGDPLARHGRTLLPDIQRLLEEQELRVRDLHAIAVGLGPGSFTGLRIGITAAKTLSFVLGCPLYGLDSLALRAEGASLESRRILVLTDAQRGEVLVARFERRGPGRIPEAIEPRIIVRREELGNVIADADEVFEAIGGKYDPALARWPSPSHLADLAVRVVQGGRPLDPTSLEPNYLRRSAAEEKADASQLPIES